MEFGDLDDGLGFPVELGIGDPTTVMVIGEVFEGDTAPPIRSFVQSSHGLNIKDSVKANMTENGASVTLHNPFEGTVVKFHVEQPYKRRNELTKKITSDGTDMPIDNVLATGRSYRLQNDWQTVDKSLARGYTIERKKVITMTHFWKGDTKVPLTIGPDPGPAGGEVTDLLPGNNLILYVAGGVIIVSVLLVAFTMGKGKKVKTVAGQPVPPVTAVTKGVQQTAPVTKPRPKRVVEGA